MASRGVIDLDHDDDDDDLDLDLKPSPQPGQDASTAEVREASIYYSVK